MCISKCIFLKMFCNLLNAALHSGVSPKEINTCCGEHCRSLNRAVFKDWLFYSSHGLIPCLSL